MRSEETGPEEQQGLVFQRQRASLRSSVGSLSKSKSHQSILFRSTRKKRPGTHLDLLVELLDDDLALDLVGRGELTTFRGPQLAADDNVLQKLGALESCFLSGRVELLLEVLLDLLVAGKFLEIALHIDASSLQVVAQVALMLSVRDNGRQHRSLLSVFC